MKTTSILSASCLVCLLFFASAPAMAQGDSIQFRYSISTMPDSTRLRFEWGQVALIGASSFRYLSMGDSIGPVTGYFRTAPFVTNGSSDTIAINRFAFFEDSTHLHNEAQLDTAQIDSLANAWYLALINKQIIPSTSVFSSTSTIKYITGIYKVGVSTPLMDWDTVTMYVNGSGQLRYTTSTGSNRNHTALTGANSGDTVYVAVRRVADLPSGVTLVTERRQVLNQEASIDYACAQYLEGCDTVSQFKFNAFVPEGSADPQVSDISANYFSNRLRLFIAAQESGPALLHLFDLIGREVWTQDVSLQAGSSQYSYSLPSLRPGPYYLYLETVSKLSQTKFTLIK